MGSVRSVFISDVHLGSQFANTKALIEFLTWLKEERPDRIYIVGDFIDGWKLKRNWLWTDDSNRIIRKLLGFVKRGTEVYYLAGNHDEFLRHFIEDFHELDFGGIHIREDFVHECVDGRRLLVVHGDSFDATIRYAMKYARWICYLGDVGYDLMIRVNSVVNWFRKHLGMSYWSLSKAIKHKVKQATSYIGGFETILADYAEEKKCEGVVCGHIHHPAIKKIQNIDYYNCGDWVETCSAIIEYRDGRIELYQAERAH